MGFVISRIIKPSMTFLPKATVIKSLHQLLLNRAIISSRLFSSDKPSPSCFESSESQRNYRNKLKLGGHTIEEFRDIALEMLERGTLLNAREIAWITSKYVEPGAEDEGRSWLKTVRNRGLSPTKDEMLKSITLKRGSVYRSIMAVLYESKISGLSREPLIIPTKDEEKLAPAIEFCLSKRDIKEAVGLYLRLAQYEYPDFDTHYAILKGVCRWGDAEDIEVVGKVVEVMLYGGSKVIGKSCVHIMEGFVRHGMKSEGMRILKLVRFYGIGPDKEDIDKALKDKPIEIRLSVLEALDGN